MGKDSWPLGPEIMTLVCCCLAHPRCSGFVASERGCYKIPGRNAEGGGSDNRREVLLERHSRRDMDEFIDSRAKDPNRPYFLALSKN